MQSMTLGIASESVPDDLLLHEHQTVATVVVTHEKLLEGFLDQIAHAEIDRVNREIARQENAPPPDTVVPKRRKKKFPRLKEN